MYQPLTEGQQEKQYPVSQQQHGAPVLFSETIKEPSSIVHEHMEEVKNTKFHSQNMGITIACFSLSFSACCSFLWIAEIVAIIIQLKYASLFQTGVFLSRHVVLMIFAMLATVVGLCGFASGACAVSTKTRPRLVLSIIYLVGLVVLSIWVTVEHIINFATERASAAKAVPNPNASNLFQVVSLSMFGLVISLCCCCGYIACSIGQIVAVAKYNAAKKALPKFSPVSV